MKPIAVELLLFQEPMDAVGLSVASSCKSRGQRNRGTHQIEYYPWMRHFKVTFTDSDSVSKVSMIHENRVKSWVPGEEIAPELDSKPQQEPQRQHSKKY